MPFGLVPGMRVLVHNVLPQKQKYFKSTILTNFEILEYAPKVAFVTANLYVDVYTFVSFFGYVILVFRRTEDGYAGNWGKPFNLGTGFLLPNAILVYTQLEILKIRSLRLYHACAICPKTVLKCTTHAQTLQTTFTYVYHTIVSICFRFSLFTAW